MYLPHPFAVLWIVLLSGCTATQETPVSAAYVLADSSWVVARLSGQELVAGVPLTLDFSADGRLTGSGGCNRLNGRYQSADGSVQIGPLASTRRFCAQPEGIMTQERALIAALENSRTASFEQGQVRFRNDAGALVLTALQMRRVALGGEVRQEGEALFFSECLSNQSYLLSKGGDYEALKAAYQAAAAGSGEALYTTLEGWSKPQEQTKPERGGADSLVVSRFIGTWPSENCERSRATALLKNTRWRIVQLLGKELEATQDHEEPHLLLTGANEEQRYRATVGCNQFSGAADAAQDRIRFYPGPATLKACPPALEDDERRLIEVLSEPRRFRIIGNTLELIGPSNRSIGLFRAVYL